MFNSQMPLNVVGSVSASYVEDTPLRQPGVAGLSCPYEDERILVCRIA